MNIYVFLVNKILNNYKIFKYFSLNVSKFRN